MELTLRLLVAIVTLEHCQLLPAASWAQHGRSFSPTLLLCPSSTLKLPRHWSSKTALLCTLQHSLCPTQQQCLQLGLGQRHSLFPWTLSPRFGDAREQESTGPALLPWLLHQAALGFHQFTSCLRRILLTWAQVGEGCQPTSSSAYWSTPDLGLFGYSMTISPTDTAKAGSKPVSFCYNNVRNSSPRSVILSRNQNFQTLNASFLQLDLSSSWNPVSVMVCFGDLILSFLHMPKVFIYFLSSIILFFLNCILFFSYSLYNYILLFNDLKPTYCKDVCNL